MIPAETIPTKFGRLKDEYNTRTRNKWLALTVLVFALAVIYMGHPLSGRG